MPTDPTVIAVGTFRGEALLWDVAADHPVGSPVKVHGAGVRDIAVSGNGRTMAVTADDGLVSLWGDVAGQPPIDALVADPSFDLFPLATATATADGRLVAIFDEADGIHEIRRGDSPDTPGVVLGGPDGPPNIVWAFDAAGERLLAQQSMHDSPLVVYDTSTGDVLWTQPQDDRTWGWSTLSPDGTMVAFEQNPTIELWNVDTGERVAAVEMADLGLEGVGTVTQLMFSTDGRFLDVPTSAGPVRLSVPDLRRVSYVPAARAQCKAVRLPGGDIVAMNGPGRLTRFDMDNGTVVATGRGRDMTTIGCLALSPDGTMVAGSRPASATVSLFDAETARPIGLPIPAGGLFEAVFADEQLRVGLGSSRLIGLGIDGSVTSWNLDPDTWQAIACHAAGRNLTREEWTEYVGDDEPYRATCVEWPVP